MRRSRCQDYSPLEELKRTRGEPSTTSTARTSPHTPTASTSLVLGLTSPTSAAAVSTTSLTAQEHTRSRPAPTTWLAHRQRIWFKPDKATWRSSKKFFADSLKTTSA